MTTLKCNLNLYLLIHELQVEAFEAKGLELTMEEALELYLISKRKTHEKESNQVQEVSDN